jgi:hypothetical protein
MRVRVTGHFPKYVVSMDKAAGINTFKGVRHLHLREFLMRVV